MEFTGPSPDRRLSHIPSFRDRGDLHTVHSWLHGRKTCTFEVASGKRTGPSGVAAPPPNCQRQAKLQATELAHMEGHAGKLAALEVSGAAPSPKPCSLGPAKFGKHDASRRSIGPSVTRSSHSAGSWCWEHSHLFHCKPFRAVPLMRTPANPSTLSEHLQSWPRS